MGMKLLVDTLDLMSSASKYIVHPALPTALKTAA